MRRSTRLLLTALTPLILSAASKAPGQHPFEQRPPQAPLEHPVSVNARIGAGDRWTYHFGLNQTTTTQRQADDGRDAGSLETTRLIQNATVALRVVSVDAQTRTATIEATFERLLVVTGDDQEQTEFRWSKDGAVDDPGTDLDRVLTALATSTLTARVGRSGDVRGVAGYGRVIEAIDASPGFDRSALGLLAPSAIGSTLGLIWTPGSVSGASRNVTNVWTSARRASLSQIGAVSVTQELEVERIEDGVLKAGGEATLRLLPPSDPPGPGAPTIELLEQGGRMLISWDLDRGCSASASERLDFEAVLSLGPARLGVTMRSERSAALDAPHAEPTNPDDG